MKKTYKNDCQKSFSDKKKTVDSIADPDLPNPQPLLFLRLK
jgi:hypothetical protein